MLNKRLTELEAILKTIKTDDAAVNGALDKIKQIREEENEVPKVFTVKHYVSDEHPSLRGIGVDIFVAEDRDEVEEFAADLNRLLARIPPHKNSQG
ncbi:hypothetical protein JA13_036 [Dickeya phage vB_DsoM_JA13]|uniref:Uncharacterized protein n=1 Tax=Dickeya phage vB_DsoM_JA13 TaxID=2283030 RepID=A0A384ZW21_9CAUD|nr:hypothetical protein JA13_036 [Dickeya phage vB_DsoM_JA13]